MVRLQATTRNALARFARWREGFDAVAAEPGEEVAVILEALCSRQRDGLTTSLRQLHTITNLPQPEALRIVKQLEAAGAAVIETNLSDAFESLVALAEPLTHRIEASRNAED